MSKEKLMAGVIVAFFCFLIALIILDVHQRYQPTDKNYTRCVFRLMDDKPDSMLPYARKHCSHLNPEAITTERDKQ